MFDMLMELKYLDIIIANHYLGICILSDKEFKRVTKRRAVLIKRLDF